MEVFMESLAFILVIFSTLTHAIWNLILKKVQGGVVFLWIFTTFTWVLYIPIIILNFNRISSFLNISSFLFCTLSIIMHILYFFLLEKAYYYGDLSIIYPITRGLSPVFTIIFAICFMNESLNIFEILGTGLILFGTFLLSITSEKNIQMKKAGLFFAILCSISITTYTLTDKYIMATLAVSPFLLDFLNNIGRSIVLTPYIFKNSSKAKYLFKNYKKEAFIIAILSPISYLMILFAMKHMQISIISPMRQLSIVIGSFLGIVVLKESSNLYKKIGVMITFIGVVLILK